MTPEPQPAVSVVVATRNRSALLPRLFEALARQTTSAFDLTIVDDGSTDATAELLPQLAANAPFPTTVITGEGRGPAVGRTLGWRSATAPVIAFTDDDCVPTDDWLTAGLAVLEHADIVVGRTRPNPDQVDRLGPYSRTLSVSETRFFQTCNAFYRRADLERHGGFDEDFDRPGGEDTDLALRVLGDGHRVDAFADEALVYHDISESRLRDALRVASRWTGVARLIAKHPELRRRDLHHGLFWQPSHPWLILAWLGIAGTTRDRRAVLLGVPWCWHTTTRHIPSVIRRKDKLRHLPGYFLLDTAEVVAMVRGSVRAETLVL